MTIADQLNDVLKEINNIEGIKTSLVASREGLVIHSIKSDKSPEVLAAMSAAMMGAVDHISLEMGNSSVDRVIAESNNGKIIALGAGTKALLLVMTQPDANLDSILNNMTNASEEIKKILS